MDTPGPALAGRAWRQPWQLPLGSLGLLLTAEDAVEVGFNRLPVACGHAAGQVLEDPGPLGRGQLGPALGVDLLGDVLVTGALTAVVGNLAVGHGLSGLTTTRLTAGLLTATGSGSAVASATAFFLLVLQFFDEFIEAVDDLLLDLLGLGAAAGDGQAVLDHLHLAGHGAQVLLVLPGLHVQEHQGADGLVAL